MQKTDVNINGTDYQINQFESLSDASQMIGESQLLSIINRGYRSRCRGYVLYHQKQKKSEAEIQQLLDDYFPQDAPNQAVVALEKAISSLGDSSIPPDVKRALAAKFLKVVE